MYNFSNKILLIVVQRKNLRNGLSKKQKVTYEVAFGRRIKQERGRVILYSWDNFEDVQQGFLPPRPD